MTDAVVGTGGLQYWSSGWELNLVVQLQAIALKPLPKDWPLFPQYTTTRHVCVPIFWYFGGNVCRYWRPLHTLYFARMTSSRLSAAACGGCGRALNSGNNDQNHTSG